MGKKTKFINKETSTKFHLLHRSQLDAAYAGDAVPSEFVLVEADESANDNKKTRREKEASNIKLDSEFFSSNIKSNHDHINALGFVNDGYDYSQHLKEMGGGNFIGKDGKSQAIDFSYNKEKEMAFQLPEDALPSEKDLDRDLQAITISHDLMDEDIRAALFDGEDEEGEFEELNDDFITEAMMEPLESDFDYDAHIAAMIARSEEKLGMKTTARGWDGEGDKALRGRRVRHTDEGSESDEEEDDDEEEFSDGEEAFVDPISEEERQKIELAFERTLGEYDEEEIGELEDDEEQLEGGIIELDGDDVLFNNMIDEFLQDKKDEIWAEGTLVQKGTRSTILVKKGQDPKSVITSTIDEIQSAPVDITKEVTEQTALQVESLQYLKDLDEFGEGYVEIETCQEYLAEEKEVEKWDCESILSTYSTLDNHPSLIKDTNTRFRAYKSRHEKTLDKEAKSSSDTSSIGTREAVPRQASSSAPGHIVLSGKLNLPEGFGPHKTGDSKKIARQQALKAGTAGHVVQHTLQGGNGKKMMSLIPEVEEEEESSESEGEEGEGEDSDSSFYEKQKKATPVGGRPVGESAEEKRLRKLAVKEDRKTKRSGKKDLKNAYKTEMNRMTSVEGRKQTTDHVSVFKYSN